MLWERKCRSWCAASRDGSLAAAASLVVRTPRCLSGASGYASGELRQDGAGRAARGPCGPVGASVPPLRSFPAPSRRHGGAYRPLWAFPGGLERQGLRSPLAGRLSVPGAPLAGGWSAPIGASPCLSAPDGATRPRPRGRAHALAGLRFQQTLSLVHIGSSPRPCGSEEAICTRGFWHPEGAPGEAGLTRQGPPTIPPAGPLPFAPLRGLRSGAQPVDLWTAGTRRPGCRRASGSAPPAGRADAQRG